MLISAAYAGEKAEENVEEKAIKKRGLLGLGLGYGGHGGYGGYEGGHSVAIATVPVEVPKPYPVAVDRPYPVKVSHV